MLVLNGFVPPGTDSPDPPVACGETFVLRAKGFVPMPAVVAERPSMLFCGGDCGVKSWVVKEGGPPAVAVSVVGEVCVVRAKGLVDFGFCDGGEVAKFAAPVLGTTIDCRKGFVPVWLGICRPAGGGGCWKFWGCC
jgi:hypothetical protein